MSKKTLIIITAIFFMTAGTILAGPGLTLKSDAFDFGYAPYNTRISQTFWIYSTGTDTLKIEKVVPGCGCTKAPLEKDVLAPGDSTKLEIIFNTNKYNGKVVKRIKVTSNADPADRVITISAFIDRDSTLTTPLAIDPGIIDFSSLDEANIDKIKFALKNDTDSDIKTTLVAGPEDLFEIKLPGKVKAGRVSDGELKVRAKKLPDSFQKSFTFKLDDKANTCYTIPIVKSEPGNPPSKMN